MLEQIDPNEVSLYRWKDFDITDDNGCVNIYVGPVHLFIRANDEGVFVDCYSVPHPDRNAVTGFGVTYDTVDDSHEVLD